MEQVKEALLRVHARVADLQALGGNTQVRRALSIIASEVNALSDVHVMRICDDGGGRGDGGRGLRSDLVDDNSVDANLEGDGPLPLMTLQAEVRSEDRRRQMFVDPTEATQAAFYDFYTGRLDTLELRVSERTRFAVDEAHAAAIEELRRSAPLITVLSVAEPDRKKIAEALRSLAHIFETQAAPELAPRKLGMLVNETCTPVSEEAGATRWKENGTVLEQQFRQVYRCIAEDACCENEAYSKSGPWTWREVWRDGGNPVVPPPTLPPPFQPFPWQNACQVFPGPVNGTVSSDWGWRTIGGNLDFHPGTDIAVPVGTQVLAAAGGTVVHLNSQSPGGETGVIVRTGNEIRQYWHVDPDPGLQIGMAIAAGNVLGVTANHPHPHLHFARYAPPGGDWTKKSDFNSMQPCP